VVLSWTVVRAQRKKVHVECIPGVTVSGCKVDLRKLTSESSRVVRA